MRRSNQRMVAWGVYTGLFWGIFAWAGLPYFGIEASRAAFFAFVVLGVTFGAWTYGSRTILAALCGGMGMLVGLAGFLGGFIGALAYYGRSPQVGSFAFFVGGPYGATIGAILGLVIWARITARGKPSAQWSTCRPSPPTVWDRELDGPDPK